MRVAVLLLLAACGEPEPAGPVDHTLDFVSDIADPLAMLTADMQIEPYSDQTWCFVGTYEGPDVGIVGGQFLQNESFGHHVILMETTTSALDMPDGTVVECSETNTDLMTESRPFVFPDDLGEAGGTDGVLELPDGLATKLRSGTRYVIQAHHINYTDTPILVNSAVFLDVVPEDEVTTWAAPWVHTNTDMVIPAGESKTIDVTCTFEDDVFLLNMLGHMHEYGTSYRIVHHKLDGSEEVVYDIPDWDVYYRDSPPIEAYDLDAFEVKAGESFTTTCSWNNPTDADISFPSEMCASVGFAYPMLVTDICSPD